MQTRKDTLDELVASLDIIRKRMFFRDAAAKSRISPSQWLALRIISLNPQCTVKFIAENMQITPSAATQLVDKLAESKFIIRKEDANDRRGVVISLAKKTGTEIASLRKQALERVLNVFTSLSDTELKQLATLNRKVADALLKTK